MCSALIIGEPPAINNSTSFFPLLIPLSSTSLDIITFIFPRAVHRLLASCRRFIFTHTPFDLFPPGCWQPVLLLITPQHPSFFRILLRIVHSSTINPFPTILSPHRTVAGGFSPSDRSFDAASVQYPSLPPFQTAGSLSSIFLVKFRTPRPAIPSLPPPTPSRWAVWIFPFSSSLACTAMFTSLVPAKAAGSTPSKFTEL